MYKIYAFYKLYNWPIKIVITFPMWCQTPHYQHFRSWCLHLPHLCLHYNSPWKGQPPGCSQQMNVPDAVLLILQDYLCRVLVVYCTLFIWGSISDRLRLSQSCAEVSCEVLFTHFSLHFSFLFLWVSDFHQCLKVLLSFSDLLSFTGLSWWISHPLDYLGVYFKENLIEKHQWYFISPSLLFFLFISYYVTSWVVLIYLAHHFSCLSLGSKLHEGKVWFVLLYPQSLEWFLAHSKCQINIWVN